MSDLATGGGTDYPDSLDTFTDRTDDSDEVKALEWNNVVNAHIKLQQIIGTTPSGSKADFKTYLQVEHNADGTHKTTFENPTLVNPTWATDLTIDADIWPSFSAYRSGTVQAIGSGSTDIVQFNTENYDTNSNYNNTGSTVSGIPAWTFKPSVAGLYLFNAKITMKVISNGESASLFLYKNGVQQQGYIMYNHKSSVSDVEPTAIFLATSDGTDEFLILASHSSGVSRNLGAGAVSDAGGSVSHWDGTRIA